VTSRALFATVCALAAACSSASGTASGGEPRFDAGPPEMPAPPAPPGPDGGLDGDVDAGVATFTEIWTTLIGPPPARASCTFGSGCHGDASQAGAVTSGGFVCPKPASASAADVAAAKTACFDSLKTGPAGMLTGADPKQMRLYTIMRKQDGSPTSGAAMPLQPSSVALGAFELSRIESWIRAGAKND
jgi:hypothetical protein